MIVRFDATFEDFVDVCKRSQQDSSFSYLVLMFVVVVCSASLGGLIHWLFQSWLVTIVAALSGCVAGAYGIIESREKLYRDHLQKQVDPNTPVPTEVEISEKGVSASCLGHTLVQEWSTIDQIEETDDAIYFRNKFGQYCSARKRGFASDDELSEFLRLARTWQAQT